jgi:Zn-dependent M28 family amino/carboxypeptidase
MKKASLAFTLALVLVACSREPVAPAKETTGQPTAAVSAKAAPTGAHPSAQVEKELHRHIAELADDAYEGRAPGTAGEEKTVNYLVQEFQALGLEAGNGDSWYQQVPISAVTTSPDTIMQLRGTDFSLDLAYGSEMMIATQRQTELESVTDSQLVFAGYGIVAPERGWNDYAGLDVKGKTVVVLVNDPGYATQNPALFNGNTMTYYGRWDYKYAEAARQGAAAAIIVHETAPAAYPWEVVKNSWSGANIGLTAQNKHIDKLAVEAWVPLASAQQLFGAAGMNYEQSKAAAAVAGFEAQQMGDVKMSLTLNNSVSSSMSRNVLGLIPGSESPDEVIIYTAHWDHLGVRPGEEGDNIYNGASDNASGVAGLLALARLFAEQPEPPKRSILFLAVTAEEAGLLGSRWYGENPVYTPAKTIANFNMDNIAAGNVGKTRDIAVVGYGNSELENYLAEAAAGQGRVVVQEPAPEKGFYYRSDHFSLAKVGIPALYLTRSIDSVEHGAEWGAQRLQDYIANDYHKPSDEYDPAWDLSGSAQEVLLLQAMGSRLAASRDFPNWNEGTEFKRIRDTSLAQ